MERGGVEINIERRGFLAARKKENAPVMRQLLFHYPLAFVPVHSLKLTWALKQTWTQERENTMF